MSRQNLNTPIKSLENLELAGITFIRDYIQFLFDGPILNTYTLPQVRADNKEFSFTQYGYYDTLCSLIGKCVHLAYEEKENRIVIQFKNNMELIISLKMEDRQCAEAVMLQIEHKGVWEVW